MRRFLSRRNIIIALIIALVVGVGWWNRSRSQKALSSQVTATVVRKDIEERFLVTGQVRAQKAATLNFPSSGKLAYVHVVSGDRVRAWQALAGLDVADLKIAVRDSYYRYLAADANAKLVEDAVKGHASDESFTQKNERITAQVARDIAYDNWLIAKRAVANANLISPFAGVVTAVSVNSAGDTVSVTDGVTLVDPSSLYFEVNVDETDLTKIKIGDTAVVSLDAFPDQEFTATIKSIGFATQIDTSGASVLLVKLSFDPTELTNLRLGLSGDAEITLASAKNALVVPIDAVNNNQVQLLDGNKIDVETGIASDTEIEIKSGLSEGQIIVVL